MYILESLSKKDIFLNEFNKLKKRYKFKDYDKFYVYPELTLRWTIDNEDFIISNIIKIIRKNLYKTPVAKETKVFIGDKERLLYQFDWPEKILHGAISSLLMKEFEKIYPDVLNSYRKGRSIYTTLIKVREFIKSAGSTVFIYRNDISSYGDSIKHDILLELLQNYIKEKIVLDILQKIIKFKYFVDSSENLKEKKLGLPTGSPINNIMTNLYLMDLDKKIESLYTKESLYFRYGDDIIIISKNRSEYDKVKFEIEKTVDEKCLQLNSEKKMEYVFNKEDLSNHKIKYLGFMIDKYGNLSLTQSKRISIKRQIYFIFKKAIRLSYKDLNTEKEKLRFLIEVYNHFIFNGNFLNNISAYLRLIENTNEWKILDKWVAKIILKLVYRKKSSKTLFAIVSLQNLRNMGLISILYLKNLYLFDKVRFKKYKNKVFGS